jgi:hypothetical protein
MVEALTGWAVWDAALSILLDLAVLEEEAAT